MKHLFRFSVMLLALLLPALATAHDFEVDGIYYNINGNNAIVTYKGPDFYSTANEYSGSVVIPATVTHNGTTYPVTAIGDRAFYDCTGLTSIDIPNSVTIIGDNAFYGCTGLTGIVIPNSVTYIGNSAFYGCTGLTSVVIPNSVTAIGEEAFFGCTGLTSIDIPNSVIAIGNQAFYKCTGLTSIVVESGNQRYDSRNNCNAIIETADNKLIYGCNNTIIPNSVTAIGDYAFSCCTGLTSVNIPNSVTAIGRSAFYGCTGLTSIDIPNSVTAIGEGTFEGCTGLTSIVIPNLVTEIGEYAFYGCTGLTSVIIPNSVTSIGLYAFYGCTGLTSIDIPNSVTTICNRAFEHCTGLTSIEIPNSVTEIGYGAFYGCTGLTSIVVESGNQRYDSRNSCNAIIETASNTLIVGCNNTIIPNSVTAIGDEAFHGCIGLTSVNIPNSVNSIGEGAFEGCTGLTSIVIPNSVTAIGRYVFRGCTGLTSIDIPNSVTEIGYGAFNGCTGLTGIIIPNSVTSIGYQAFAGCTGLTDVYCYIADLSRVSSGNELFYLCDGDYSGRTLHVLQGTADAYRADVKWYPFFGQIVEDLMPDLPGDVNGDGEVNIADINAVIDMILGGNGNTSAADVNGDGEVNIADINAVIDIILGETGEPDHIQVFNFIINNRAHRDGVVVFSQNTAKVVINYTRNTIQITGSYKDVDDQMHSYSTPEMQMTKTSGIVYSFFTTDDLGNGEKNLNGSIDFATSVMKYEFQQDDYTIVCTTHLIFSHVVTTISDETGTSHEYDRPQYALMLDSNAETCALMIMGFVFDVNGEEHESPVTYNNLEVTITDEGYIISADQASSNQGTSYDLTDVNIIIDEECEHISGSFKTTVSRHEFSGNLFE